MIPWRNVRIALKWYLAKNEAWKGKKMIKLPFNWFSHSIRKLLILSSNGVNDLLPHSNPKWVVSAVTNNDNATYSVNVSFEVPRSLPCLETILEIIKYLGAKTGDIKSQLSAIRIHLSNVHPNNLLQWGIPYRNLDVFHKLNQNLENDVMYGNVMNKLVMHCQILLSYDCYWSLTGGMYDC